MRRGLCTFIAFVSLTAPLTAQTSILPTLQGLRAGYPATLTPAQLAELLNKTAWEHRADGWGLLRKDGGNTCPHVSGAPISCDFLFNSVTKTGFDVLIASDAEAVPSWQGPLDFSMIPHLFVAPVAPPNLPPSTPSPQPQPLPAPPPVSSVDLTPILTQIAALRNQVDALSTQTAAVKDDTKAIRSTWTRVASVLGKYVAPAIAAWIAARSLDEDTPAVPVTP